ncbi:hypothetical protein [Actinosynnema sp. NPDC020468]|uniref:hypothetical protein n=1 Tax=Actinosynnema sp. NPDC020468 TaxID=3154488 RepID=UPI0034113CDF
MSDPSAPLTGREVALLRATAAHRVELTCGRREPDLRVDSLPFCDYAAAWSVVNAGLIEPESRAPAGHWVPARLTAAGETALTA